MSNVVPMPKADKPKWTERYRNAEKAMSFLRQEMYKYDYKELAKEVGVSTSCIMAIRSGRTKWPRHTTFFGLLTALDLDMLLVRRSYDD